MIPLVEAYNDEIARRIEVWPQWTNRASSLGHPCERYLCYCRVCPEQRTLPTVGMQRRFEDGHLHEKAVLRILEDAGERFGFQVIERQRDLSVDQFLRAHEISGHPDAMIATKDGRVEPVDVKSCSPYVFQKLDTVEDMRHHKSAYVQAYPAQLQIYELGTGCEEASFLLKDKASGDVKQIGVPLDYAYAESLLQKADRINQHVHAGTLPEPLNDEAVCSDCPFAHICPTTVEYGRPPVIADDPELISKVERWEQLKAAAAEYEPLNKELGRLLEGEENLIVGDFHATGRWQHREGYTVKPVDYWTKIIRRVAGVPAAMGVDGRVD